MIFPGARRDIRQICLRSDWDGMRPVRKVCFFTTTITRITKTAATTTLFQMALLNVRCDRRKHRSCVLSTEYVNFFVCCLKTLLWKKCQKITKMWLIHISCALWNISEQGMWCDGKWTSLLISPTRLTNKQLIANANSCNVRIVLSWLSEPWWRVIIIVIEKTKYVSIIF